MRIKTNTFQVRFLFSLVALFVTLKTIRGFTDSSASGGIWNYIQVVLVVWGFILLVKHLPELIKTKTCIKWIVVYSIWSLLWSFIFISSFSQKNIFALLKIPYFMTIVILFYYCGKKIDISRSTILKIVYYLIVCIVIINMGMYYLGGSTKGAVSDVYYGLTLLPLVLMYTDKSKEMVPIVFLMIALILTQKRAGLIALVAMLIVFYFHKAIIERNMRKWLINIIKLLCLVALILVVTRLVAELFEVDIVARMLRLAEDGGSGRDVRWTKVLQAFSELNVFNQLVGVGKNSLDRAIGAAHNDFLQIAYDHGMIALVLYVGFYISLIRLCIEMIKKNYDKVIYLIMGVICSLVLAMFSYFVIDATYSTNIAIILGLILADYKKNCHKDTIFNRIES